MRSVIRVRTFGCALSIVALTVFIGGCGNEPSEDDPSRVLSYFPLSLNNYWTYAVYAPNEIEAVDTVTVRIDSLVQLPDINYSRMSDSPQAPVWITKDPDGNYYWTEEPGQPVQPYLLVSAGVNEPWMSKLGDCQQSVTFDTDTTLDTPNGRFWQSRMIQLQCDVLDRGVLLGIARGTGPVLWKQEGLVQRTWLLVETIALDDYSTLARPDEPQPGPTGP